MPPAPAALPVGEGSVAGIPRRSDYRAAYVAYICSLEANLKAEGKPVAGLAPEPSQVPSIPATGILSEYVPKVQEAYGAVAAEALAAYVTQQPFFDLGTFPVPYELARLAPPNSIPNSKFLLLAQYERVFLVGCAKPKDPGFRRAMVKKLETVATGSKRPPYVIFAQCLESAFDGHLAQAKMAAESGATSMAQAIKLGVVGGRNGVAKPVERAVLSLGEMAEVFAAASSKQLEEAPRLMLDVIIAKAFSPDDPSKRSSDVHIEPGPPEGNFVVRYRIDGRLVDIDSAPMAIYSNFAATIKGVCAGMQMTDKGKLQDGRYRLALKVGDKIVKLDLRVSCVPQGSETGGDAPEKFVLRILDSSAERPPLLDLVGGDTKLEKLLRDVLDLPKGLILLTGPTGCGKTTTLSRFILELAAKKVYSIYTIEDPIEYEYAPEQGRVSQVQVDNTRGVTFANTLRNLLRMDPDIVLVGELRDTETAQIATQAALTGHQVLSTLHTNDAVGSVSRLADMGVPHYLLAETLVCVVAQRLLPALCNSCKLPVTLPDSVKRQIPEVYRAAQFSHALGCPVCRGLGYRGRVPVVDVFYVDVDARRMIINQTPLADLRRYNEARYSPGLTNRALYLASQGRVDIATALTVRDDVTLEV